MITRIPTLAALATVLAIPATAQETIVVSQTAPPLQITSYKAEFQRRSQYRSEGIRHEIEYRNTSGREIMASQLGLVSFSIFNEFLDRTGGIDMDAIAVGGSSKGTWVATALAGVSPIFS